MTGKTADGRRGKKEWANEKTQSRHTVITRASCRFISCELASNRHNGDTPRAPLLQLAV